jgi:TolB protein
MVRDKPAPASSDRWLPWGLIALLVSIAAICLVVIVTDLNTDICAGCHAPQWSPDGQWLAAAMDVGTQESDIWVIRVDGTQRVNLTTASPTRDRFPTWSPDGRRLAFLRDSDIWAMDVDGVNPVNLTSGSPDLDWQPAWSPDGQWIAFSSNRDGSYDIWIMRPDGSDLRNLTGDSALSEEAPAWIPNSSTILYAGGADRSVYDIHRMNADGSNRQVILSNNKYNYDPAESAHGIIFTSLSANDEDVWIMQSDGSNVRNLTNTIYADNEAHWSPDGQQITFASYRDGNSHIWFMNADATNPRRLKAQGYGPRTKIAIVGLVVTAILLLMGGVWYLLKKYFPTRA